MPSYASNVVSIPSFMSQEFLESVRHIVTTKAGSVVGWTLLINKTGENFDLDLFLVFLI